MKEMEDFLAAQRLPKTREDYRRNLTNLFKFLNVETFEDFKKVELSDIFKYRNYLKEEKNNSDSSIKTKLLALSSFYVYLNNANILDWNFAKPVIEKLRPYLNKKEGTYLNEDEIQKFINVCKSPRETAMMMLFLNNGIRVGSLINIRLDDYQGKKLIIREKGGKIREVTLNDATKIALDTYLLTRKKTDCPNLFVSNGGKPMYTSSIDRTIDKLAKKAGITDKKISAHSLRRTVATDMYRIGNDILTIKEVLGHCRISTTALYIKNSRKMAENAINDRVIGTKAIMSNIKERNNVKY